MIPSVTKMSSRSHNMSLTRIFFVCASVFLAVFSVAILHVQPAGAVLTNGANAIDLLGQYDQTSFTDPVPAYAKSGTNDGPNTFGFNAPEYIALDGTNHRLFVSEVTNNRVLVYNLTAGNLLVDHFLDNVLV